MPRVMPTGTAQFFKQRTGFAPIVLLDLQTADGTNYYWSDFAGSYPMRLGAGGNVAYAPWVKPGLELERTRTPRSNIGDIVVQNLSGNTIERDVMTQLVTREFEGAFCLVRLWSLALAAALDEYSGFLQDQRPGEEEFAFTLNTMIDEAGTDALDIFYQATCPWRFKSRQCGSVGSAVACNKSFTDCSDVTRAASEHFGGILAPPPLPLVRISRQHTNPRILNGPVYPWVSTLTNRNAG